LRVLRVGSGALSEAFGGSGADLLLPFVSCYLRMLHFDGIIIQISVFALQHKRETVLLLRHDT
jgi:hypothetical protein